MAERLEDVAGPPRAAVAESAAAPAPALGAGAQDPPRGDGQTSSDLAILIPERLAVAIGRRRAAWSPTDTMAAWLIGLHLVLLALIVGRGSLYIDDLRAQGYAVNQPFWEFIRGSNGTHFAPLPRILDWLQSRYLPLEHTPAVVVTLLIRLLLAIGFWRVLRRLFGPRSAALVPLALLLFTPALIPATTWYRQSITILVCTAAIVWAIDAHLRWVLYRHTSDLVLLVVITAIGLCCYEKAAAIPVILTALTVAIFAGPTATAGSGRSGRSAVRAGLVAVLASAAVVVVFLLIYRSGPYQSAGKAPSTHDVLHLSWDVSTRTVIPLLLGGPYHWVRSGYTGDPQLSTTAVAFSLLIVLVGLAVAFRRGPERTLRALILLPVWVLPSVALITAGRFAVFGMTLSTATRLWADLVPGFLLVGALALLPWRIGVDRAAAPQATRSRVDGAPLELTTGVIAGALVMVIVLGGSLISSLNYASAWWENPTGRWIANARASLVNAEPYPRTLATPLPTSVMPYWVSLTFPTDAPLLLLLRPDSRFYDGDGEAKVMDASGLRSPYVPKILAQTKPAKLCVASLPAGSDAPVTIPLPKATPYALGAQVEVGLLLAESTKVEVTVVTPTGQILTPQRFSDAELPQGPHTVRFPAPLGKKISAIRVQIHATKTSCVVAARVWVPVK